MRLYLSDVSTVVLQMFLALVKENHPSLNIIKGQGTFITHVAHFPEGDILAIKRKGFTVKVFIKTHGNKSFPFCLIADTENFCEYSLTEEQLFDEVHYIKQRKLIHALFIIFTEILVAELCDAHNIIVAIDE